MRQRVLFGVGALLLLSCTGTTGSDLVTFSAEARGPKDATGTLSFVTARGYAVTLTRAKLLVGGLYLNRSVPISGAQATACYLPGVYVAEVRGSASVDLLSGAAVPFSSGGDGTRDHASTAEVWLTGGAIDAEDDRTVIVDVAGVAEKNGARLPFEASVTLGKNRATPPKDPVFPGASPMCKQRIVSPISVSLLPRQGGRLVLEVDPRPWFGEVEFSELEKVSDAPPLYRFVDATGGQPERALLGGIRSTGSGYRISFE